MQGEGHAVVQITAVYGHVVQAGDGLDDSQSQACALTSAAAGVFGFVERLEKMRPLVVCDLGTLIGDGELIFVGSDSDLAAGRGIVDSVGEEIGDGLFQKAFVSQDQRLGRYGDH